MINIGIGIGWAKALYSVANNVIANFKARVLSYPNSIFEAGPCLDATLEELNAIGLLDNASLIVTPNAYNEGILYDVIPNTTLGDMTVVRATTATRVNSAGLIEVVPRNLVTYSNTFTNAAWVKTNSTIEANSIISPDGTLNASKLNVLAVIYSGLYQIGNSQSNKYTMSLYAKKGNKDWLYFVNLSGSSVVAWFNISNGTLGTVTNGTASITDVGDGWYRCVYSDTNNISNSYFQIGLSDANNSNTPISSGFSYIWAAQLEVGPTATEYFPTTTRLNIPRIDYTNGSCPSLLVEPQRTNYVLYSEQFDNAAWTTDNATVTANNTISPNGNLTADRLVGTNTGIYDCRVFRDVSSAGTSGAAVVSIWAKADVAQKMTIGISNREYQTFDLTTLWVRYSLLVSLGGSNNFNIFAAQVDSSGTVTPGTQGTIYIWGAQLEVGSYATSYIPTVASSVTRNADVISKTGISSLIGQTEGTIFLDYNLTNFSNQEVFINSVYTNSIALGFLTDGTFKFRCLIFSNSIVTTLSSATISTLGNYKIAVKYKSGANKLFINGILIATDTSTLNFTTLLSDLTLNRVGAIFYGDNAKSLKNASIFKTALTDTECIALTTL